jgi:hypothetical protein
MKENGVKLNEEQTARFCKKIQDSVDCTYLGGNFEKNSQIEFLGTGLLKFKDWIGGENKETRLNKKCINFYKGTGKDGNAAIYILNTYSWSDGNEIQDLRFDIKYESEEQRDYDLTKLDNFIKKM